MLELYEKNKSAGRSNSDRPDLVRSLIPTQAEKLEENDILEELSENHVLIFDLPQSSKEEKFIAAELKILTEVKINSIFEAGVKRTLKISIYDEISKQYVSLNRLEVHHFNNTWISFNLTKEVSDILQARSSKRFLKLAVTISSYYHQSTNNLKLSLLPVIENFDHDYPVLLLTYSIEDEINKKLIVSDEKRENGRKRKKRNVEEDYEEETNRLWTDDSLKKNIAKKYKRNNCKRKPLYINFKEIEYDLWIVQPPGYDAYQCQGRCFYPVAEHLSPTKHAIMQALIHSYNPLKASRSCCVPTVLDSISILYIDDRGVLTYRYAYKDMVVLECGCR
ncbi:bone morphogenetic protein 10-like [Sitophilus oryzae]|uniref:Bone morphogenetic protein 10-like n=1 Tax=Sitophilus oryzae TaxID=7048 RepID=A0A6J2Y1N0_SITOR|nr:bone morphogenetic protein 10-like [Sitophilus oryzae]